MKIIKLNISCYFYNIIFIYNNILCIVDLIGVPMIQPQNMVDTSYFWTHKKHQLEEIYSSLKYSFSLLHLPSLYSLYSIYSVSSSYIGSSLRFSGVFLLLTSSTFIKPVGSSFKSISPSKSPTIIEFTILSSFLLNNPNRSSPSY